MRSLEKLFGGPVGWTFDIMMLCLENPWCRDEIAEVDEVGFHQFVHGAKL